jgi:hypothetical protein
MSQPEGTDFGFCYNCAVGSHEACIGVPCDCGCPGPAPKIDAAEALRRVVFKIQQLPAVIREVRHALPAEDERRMILLTVETMIEMALTDAKRADR